MEAAASRETIAGKFVVHRRIGAGGMAQVFLARRVGRPRSPFSDSSSLDDFVVLKMILPTLRMERRIVDMFLDEARVLAMLDHDNIVSVVDVGAASGVPFIAMEYLHGQNLRHVAVMAKRRHGELPLDIALDVVARVGAGLHYAHTKKDASGRPLHIVHRDVTPHNIVVTYDGRIKIIDFGIAKAASQQREPTMIGELRGKLRYLAPEQVLSAPVDARTDVFALGCILFELTTQRRAFPQSTEEAVLRAVAKGDVPRPSDLISDYPQPIEDVLQKAMAVRPADRFASAADFVAAVDDAAAKLRTPRASQERTASFVRALFAAEIEKSALNAAQPEVQRTSIKANPFARPAAGSEQQPPPIAELPTQLETAPLGEETELFGRSDDDDDDDDGGATALGWGWIGEDPRRSAIDPALEAELASSLDTAPPEAVESVRSSSPFGTEPTYTVPPPTLAQRTATSEATAMEPAPSPPLSSPPPRRRPALWAPAAGAAGITVLVVAIVAASRGGEERARVVDAGSALVEPGPAPMADVVVDPPRRDAVDDVDAGVAVSVVDADDEAVSEAADGARAEERRGEKHHRKTVGARPPLPPLADDAPPNKAVAWLDANCRARVACAAELVGVASALKTATLDVVRAFPDDVARCVRQCRQH